MSKMPIELRFIDPQPPLSGEEQMRRDRELLRAVSDSTTPAIWIRFYRWDEPTISLGKHQRLSDSVCIEACQKYQVPIVRRPTGGRAVLHADEVTYAVVSNASEFLGRGALLSTYEWISRGLLQGLRRLGLKVQLVAGKTRGRPGTALTAPCFSSHSRFELTWQGRKIAGSAQRRLRNAFLQHGSLPLTIDYDWMGELFAVRASELRATVASLDEALGHRPRFEEVCSTLQTSFEQMLNAKQRADSGKRRSHILRC